MRNTDSKRLPTLRNPHNPEEVEIFMREVRELFRRLWVEIDELEGCCEEEGESEPPVSGVSSVTSLASELTASPTTGDVELDLDLSGLAAASHTHLKADVTDFAHTHAQADVTNLTSDLAGKVPTTRNINTNSPLTGGGALSGDLTLGISLDTPSFGWFGTGHDGALTFDGSTTVLGMAPAANVYTLTQDINATNMTVDSGVTVITGGFRVFVNGTLDLDGTIHRNGNNATGGSAGAAHSSTVLAGGTAGGSTAGGGGGGFSSDGIVFFHVASSSGLGGNSGAPGAPGNVVCRGGGGGGGTGNTGGNSGSISLTAASVGGPTLTDLIQGRTVQGPSGKWRSATGGGAGGTVTNFGAGGGGGGYVVVCAHTITGTGTISANGGNGGNATGNSGGGGGGGGGLIVLVYLTKSAITTSVTGGSPGSGSGTGAAGAAGASGYVFNFNLSGDGT